MITDNNNASSTSATSVLVKNVNIPPIANAGIDQTAFVGKNVTLNGTKSYDPDGEKLKLKYSWAK